MSESDARLFAQLVGQMLEPIKGRLQVIEERLQDGDSRMGAIEKTMRHVADETANSKCFSGSVAGTRCESRARRVVVPTVSGESDERPAERWLR